MKRALALMVLSTGLTACAAPKRAEAPARGASPDQAPPGYAERQAPGAYAPPPPPAPPSSEPLARPSGPTTAPPAPESPAASRSATIRRAANDVEASQRELDIAGGDCRNACRALGSMDRATGRICSLAQSDDEQRRCSQAKTRVYSARDQVRNTCGTCPDVSVERNAPIPSR